MILKALTIAGSDPSGGAGIQADLKTFTRLQVYGMSVVTALTAQNTTGVSKVLEVEPGFVAMQMDSVFTDLPPDAAKTGMLANAAITEAVAAKIREYGLRRLVVDPVMVSKAGSHLLRPDAVQTLCDKLLPLALLTTPNTEEAEVLAEKTVRTISEMEDAARTIYELGPKYVLVKGGHLRGAAVDVLFDGAGFRHFREERIPTRDSHGTGCVLSAAITAQLALGDSVVDAVGFAKEFVTGAIRRGLRIGKGQGPCDPVGVRNSAGR